MSPPPACREAIRRLWDYLDDDLSPQEQGAVEEHLNFCLRCCGELEFSREIRRMLDATAGSPVPGDVQARLERLLDDVLPEVPIVISPVGSGPPVEPHGSDTGAIT